MSEERPEYLSEREWAALRWIDAFKCEARASSVGIKEEMQKLQRRVAAAQRVGGPFDSHGLGQYEPAIAAIEKMLRRLYEQNYHTMIDVAMVAYRIERSIEDLPESQSGEPDDEEV